MTVRTVLQAMRELPVKGLASIVGSGNLLILAPHPDDESLGCGGLIAACCEAGRPPSVLFLTDGTASHPHSLSYPPKRLRETREAEARRALAALGLGRDRIAFLGLPDADAPQAGIAFARSVDAIMNIALSVDCATIAATWQHDPHCDHVAAHRMAEAVAAELQLRHIAYPVWGWTLPPDEPLDTVVSGARLDISAYLPAKRLAIAAHASQHGGLITDDPSGFQLPHHLLAAFDEPYEVFLDQP